MELQSTDEGRLISRGERTALLILLVMWVFLMAGGTAMLITAPRKWQDWSCQFGGAWLIATWRPSSEW